MKIVFFEIMPGEKDSLVSLLPHDHTYEFHEEALSESTTHLAAGAHIVSVFVKSLVDASVLSRLSTVKLIATRSMGVDHIDIAAANARGVHVRNVTTYASHPVAEFTFALLLAVTRRLYHAYNQLRDGSNFDIRGLKGYTLFGKKIGVLGTGRIGKNVISIARGFGMDVLAFDEHPDLSLEHDGAIHYAPLADVVAMSDILTLHVPYTPTTHHLINKETFATMKRGVILVNTSRGEVIDTHALVTALRDGTVWGAGLDVLEGERQLHDEATAVGPDAQNIDYSLLAANHVLIDMPNVIVTPHIAFETVEAVREIDRATAESIINFIDHKEQTYL
ncbi:MAG: hydroxyacid dehydrogenase [Candidatus Pacebacteria bacterium]|nr:hydroxyacid dehydrogenase [Candidatus Paceibacterota bacterium]